MKSERARIRETLDVYTARRQGKHLAAEIGFSPAACIEIAIMVSEFSTNILKYGIRGEITINRIVTPGLGVGIELIAEDDGPPLADLATAVRDGYHGTGPIEPDKAVGRGGIGAGLGAILRLSDEFEYHAGPGKKSFRAVRYLQRPKRYP